MHSDSSDMDPMAVLEFVNKLRTQDAERANAERREELQAERQESAKRFEQMLQMCREERQAAAKMLKESHESLKQLFESQREESLVS